MPEGPGGRGVRADRVLVVRNDRLGDFLLALPGLAMLRLSQPRLHIAALLPEYTASLAPAVSEIDEVVPDPGRGSGARALLGLARRLRACDLDGAIALFSTGRVAAALALAGIPYRLAPATKPAQWLFTHRVAQRRSRSRKPEFEYNLDLVRAFLSHQGVQPVAGGPPYLRFGAGEIRARREAYCRAEQLDPAHRLVFVHPGSGGSAPSVSPLRLAQLAAGLRARSGVAIIVTAGPAERALADDLAALLAERSSTVRVLHSREGLIEFAKTVAFADLLIGASTGPLHLAGALDRPTAGFYPRTTAGSSLRWRTLNREALRLAFEPPPDAAVAELDAIDMTAAAAVINERLLAEEAGAGAVRAGP